MVERSRNWGRIVGFAVWLTAATFAATTLTAWHAVALPTPTGVPRRHSSRAGVWHLTHYLSVDCACSLAVAAHLMARGPFLLATEEIVFVSSRDLRAENSLRDGLKRRGFDRPVTMSEARASGEGTSGVPLLRIEGPDGTVRFRGGYRDRNTPSGEYLDGAILADLMASRPAPILRVYGCATSQRLRFLLDPLSLLSLSIPRSE